MISVVQQGERCRLIHIGGFVGIEWLLSVLLSVLLMLLMLLWGCYYYCEIDQTDHVVVIVVIGQYVVAVMK